MKKNNRSRGFTLIELLVVIAIIGLLSSVVLASLNGARTKGRDARRLADIKQMQVALELYYSEHNAYPASTSGLATSGYISSIATDPLNESAYGYALGTDEQSYCLGAKLETSDPPVSSSCTISGYTGNYFVKP